MLVKFPNILKNIFQKLPFSQRIENVRVHNRGAKLKKKIKLVFKKFSKRFKTRDEFQSSLRLNNNLLKYWKY